MRHVTSGHELDKMEAWKPERERTTVSRPTPGNLAVLHRKGIGLSGFCGVLSL